MELLATVECKVTTIFAHVKIAYFTAKDSHSPFLFVGMNPTSVSYQENVLDGIQKHLQSAR